MILTAHITEEHIKRGRKKDPFYCPIALAVADLLIGSLDLLVGHKEERPIVVSVDGDFINFKRKGNLVPNTLPEDWEFDRAMIPGSICLNLMEFDAGRKIKPFSFEFTADDWLIPYLAKGVTYR